MSCEDCPLKNKSDLTQAAQRIIDKAQLEEDIPECSGSAHQSRYEKRVCNSAASFNNSQLSEAVDIKLEEVWCSGPVVRKRFRWFGSITLLKCGSDVRKRRLGVAD